MSGKNALLVVNSKSREGESDLSAALGFLEEQGYRFVSRLDATAPDLPDRLRGSAGGVDLVIAGGGDGTMRGLARVLAETELPLGILPLGTANDLARTLGIAPDPLKASQVIAEGRLHRIDLGWVNGHYFFNVAHLGLGVRVTRNLSPDLKQRWGIFCYWRAVMQALSERKPFSATLRCDDRSRKVSSIHIAVGNGRHYGGGMTVAEQAGIDDHLLHVYSVRPIGLWQLLTLSPSLRRGFKDSNDAVLVLEGREIEIQTRKPMAIHADGEAVTQTPARFQVLPQAIAVYVPPEYQAETAAAKPA